MAKARAPAGMRGRRGLTTAVGSPRSSKTDEMAASIVRFGAGVILETPAVTVTVWGVQVGVWRLGGGLGAGCWSHGMCWRVVGGFGAGASARDWSE